MTKSVFPTESKVSIRKSIRLQRQNLTAQERQLAAQNCTNHILNSNILENITNIAFYLAQDNELNLNILLTHCLTIYNNKKIYLPVIANNNTQLNFAQYSKTTKLKKNKYNIDEPVLNNQNNYINPQDLDLVFVPLVAFTNSGQRLGMGGGYYDQTFAFLANSLNNDNTIVKPLLIGVAYDFQCVKYLPNNVWDINLYGIATETGLCYF